MRSLSLSRLYRVLARLPHGRTVFSIALARKAPYLSTVRPRFVHLRPHYAELVIRDRRAVRNHLGTVHAIAICNGLDAATGALAEVTSPPGKRWLPKAMEVEYVAKSTTDTTCIAETTVTDWNMGADVPVRVTATQADGSVVTRGTIHLHVTDSSGGR